MARSQGKRQSPSVPPEPNLDQSTPGDIAVSRHPTGSSLALPGGATMSRANTAALRPVRASKQKQSRLWADEGENLYENKLEQEARQ